MAANSQVWPTAAAWVERLDPRREGREWKCPCPLCGGDDRFHIGEKPNGEALVGCRVCMDGQPDGQRRFIEAVQQVFPERYPLSQGQPRTRQDGPTAKRRPAISDQRSEGKAATTPAQAAAIWRAGIEATGSLAHAYLARRLAWPPAECGHTLPRTVAFLPKAAAPPCVLLPRACAGAVVFRLESAQGKLQAVQLEALDGHGRRLQPQRFRRNFGPLAGAWFRVDVDRPAGVVVVEGPVDALAAAWLRPGLAAWATCGTAGLATLTASKIQAAGWQGPVKIISDPDAKGRTAAREAEAALNKAGWDVELILRPNNDSDVADELAGAIQEKAAIVEHDGGVSAAQAITVAWESFTQKGENDP